MFRKSRKNYFDVSVERDEPIILKDPVPKPEVVVRKIIDGKLYDTSKATKICTMSVPGNEISNELRSAGWAQLMFGCDVNLYKGNNTYFCTIPDEVFAVSEEWVMKWLGRCDTDKYIELFGEPELA